MRIIDRNRARVRVGHPLFLTLGGRNRSRQEEGLKDRPAIVLALSVKAADGITEILVLAVTHTPPADAADAVAFPQVIKRRLGLDDARSWIVTTGSQCLRLARP